MIHEFFEVWNASAPRVVDNSLDVSHVAFVHKNTIGDPEHPMLPPFVVKRTEEGLTFDVTYVAKNRNKARLRNASDQNNVTDRTWRRAETMALGL